jgi:hypothetical protein
MDTVIQNNQNPIEKIEKCDLVLAETILKQPALSLFTPHSLLYNSK